MTNNQSTIRLTDIFSEAVSPKNKLNPLKIAKDIYWHINKLNEGFGKATILMESIKEQKGSKNSVFYAATFLFAFEGVYVACINSIIYLLVCYGHDLYDPLRKHYVDTPDKISKIDVELKFAFLIKHGFGTIILRECQFIRNKIAHNDFKVYDKSAKITIMKKLEKAKEIEIDYDLAVEIASLIGFSSILIKELETLFNSLSKRNSNHIE
jgi:hypothetical protein